MHVVVCDGVALEVGLVGGDFLGVCAYRDHGKWQMEGGKQNFSECFSRFFEMKFLFLAGSNWDLR